jgi:hypothetical protein
VAVSGDENTYSGDYAKQELFFMWRMMGNGIIWKTYIISIPTILSWLMLV